MEYNLLKTIEGNLGFNRSTSTYPKLTPYPANDFVNPGLGQISRLYSFYVPLHSHYNLHSVSKKVNIENLEGSGQNSENSEEPVVQNQNEKQTETKEEKEEMSSISQSINLIIY